MGYGPWDSKESNMTEATKHSSDTSICEVTQESKRIQSYKTKTLVCCVITLPQRTQ